MYYIIIIFCWICCFFVYIFYIVCLNFVSQWPSAKFATLRFKIVSFWKLTNWRKIENNETIDIFNNYYQFTGERRGPCLVSSRLVCSPGKVRFKKFVSWLAYCWEASALLHLQLKEWCKKLLPFENLLCGQWSLFELSSITQNFSQKVLLLVIRYSN